MPATAGMQAKVVKLVTSNSKDDTISLTAYNSKNASNSRNDSNNRSANNIVGTPAKAEMLATVVAGNSMQGHC
jgi:hypothetical protein